MFKFKYPNIEVAAGDWAKITDDELEEWELKCNECKKYNKEVRSQMAAYRNDFVDHATMIWGKDSKEVKYIKKMEIPWSHIREFDYYESKVIKAREDSKNTVAIEEEANKTDNLIEKAINWLMERGKVLGTDYTLKTALKFANGLAFDEEVAGRKEEISRGLLISFGGDDFCKDCAGWDGVNKRCQCGNRRVSWEADVYDDFFLNPIVYGQAY